MQKRTDVRDITVDRDKCVQLTFSDGHTATFDLVELRVHCPCAGCRNERERGVTPWPQPSSPLPLSIRSAELAGAWGLTFEWNDGHRAGIYPFTSLRQWSEDGEAPTTPDSGLRS